MTGTERGVLQEFEEVALQGCRAIKEFLTYRGNNKEYLNRAKVGAVAMGSYARLRATLANEAQIKLIQQRLLVDEKPKQMPAVSGADSE